MLTEAESKWLKRLQKVLRECPSDRLGFYTIGDPTVGVYDKGREDEIDAIMDSGNKDFGPTVELLDAKLGSLRFPSNVHTTAG